MVAPSRRNVLVALGLGVVTVAGVIAAVLALSGGHDSGIVRAETAAGAAATSAAPMLTSRTREVSPPATTEAPGDSLPAQAAPSTSGPLPPGADGVADTLRNYLEHDYRISVLVSAAADELACDVAPYAVTGDPAAKLTVYAEARCTTYANRGRPVTSAQLFLTAHLLHRLSWLTVNTIEGPTMAAVSAAEAWRSSGPPAQEGRCCPAPARS